MLARTLLSALFAGGLLSSTALAQNFSRTIVFGDSLSDNGNLAIATGNSSPGYPSRRFSNGPVWGEYFWGPLSNFYPVGAINNSRSYDFAFGGARTDNAVANPPGVPTQTAAWFARGGAFRAGDLVAIWAGANNLFQGIPVAAASPATAQATMAGIATAAAIDVGNAVSTIAGAGAGTIVVLNLPNIGAAPAFNTSPAGPLATFSASTFNTALASSVGAAANARPGANVVTVDVNGIFGEILANPAGFGFSNVTQACVAVASCAGATQAAQNAFLFYDGVHPTTAGHALIAQAVSQYVYAPTLAGLSASVTEIGLMNRRSDQARGLERLRDHEGAPGANDFFVNVFGDIGRAKTDANRYGYRWEIGGVTFGGARAIGNGFSVGLAGSVSTGEVKSADGSTRYDSTTFSADLLGGWRGGPIFVNAALGAGVNRVTDWRRKTYVGPLENKGDAAGYALSAAIEGGYDFRFGAVTLTPAGRLGFIHAATDSFAENGVVAPIHYEARKADGAIGAVELRGKVDLIAAPGRALAVYGLVGYEDYLSWSAGAVRGQLVANTARPFATAVGDLAGEGLFAGAGLSGRFGVVRLNADYRASLGKGEGTKHRLTAGLRVAF